LNPFRVCDLAVDGTAGAVDVGSGSACPGEAEVADVAVVVVSAVVAGVDVGV
jgi:hypothetical protein